jgi:hypothetical protein
VDGKERAQNGCGWKRPQDTMRDEEKGIYNAGADRVTCIQLTMGVRVDRNLQCRHDVLSSLQHSRRTLGTASVEFSGRETLLRGPLYECGVGWEGAYLQGTKTSRRGASRVYLHDNQT